MQTTTIDLLRHGEVEGGDCFRGSQDDPLSELGKGQMQKQITGHQWDIIISSPLSRCYQFANHLSHQLQIPLQSEPDFREISFGDWEGKTAEQITAVSPQALEDFYNNPNKYPPPAGEPFEDYRQRVKSAWEQHLYRFRGQNLLIITHGGVIRTLFTFILKIPNKQGFQIEIPHACLSRFKCFYGDESHFIQLIFHKPL